MIRQWKTHLAGFAGHRSFSMLDSAVLGLPAASQFSAAIVAGDSETSITTHDYTQASFGTPDGAMFLFNICDTRGTRDEQAHMSIGATDKTNQCHISINALDAAAEVSCSRFGDETHVMSRFSSDHTGAVISTAQYNAEVTDGLQVNWDDAETTAWETTALLFKASSIATGVVRCTTEDAAVTETIGFEADVIIVFSNNAQLGVASGFHNVSIGFVCYDGATITQCSAFHGNVDAAADSTPSAYVSETRCGGQVSATALNATIEASNITSTSFDLTARDGASNDDYCYIAFNIGIKKAWTGIVDTPDDTGTDNSYTITGITGEFGMHVMSLCQSTGTFINDSTAGGFGLSMFNATDSASHSFSDEDAIGTMNTSNMVASVMAYLDADDQSDQFAATLSAFGAEVLTPNVSNVIGVGTPMKWPTLVIGAAGTAVGAGGADRFLRNRNRTGAFRRNHGNY